MQIKKQSFGKFEEYVLENPLTGEAVYILPAYGGVVRKISLSAKGQPFTVLNAGETDTEFLADSFYPSALLFPWVNRTRDGKYTFEGKEHQLPINETNLNNAIHGFVCKLPFSITKNTSDESSAELFLEYRHEGDFEGFPFPFCIEIQYTLTSSEGLHITHLIKNTGKGNLPMGLGWHPYFQFDDETADDWKVRFPAKYQYISDSQMIPAGREPFAGGEWYDLNGQTLDNVFALENFEGICKTELYSKKKDITLEVWQEAGPQKHNFIVVFVPNERNRIAIEPMTANTNALNSGEGLIVLKAGEEYQVSCGVKLY